MINWFLGFESQWVVMSMFSENYNSLPTPPFHLNNLYNNWSTPKAPFIIIPRHPVSPGLTNHNHSQRGIASRDPMLLSDWLVRCQGCRAEILRPRDMRNVSPGCRVDIFKLETRSSNEGSRKFTITEKAPSMAFSWLKAPTSAFTFKTLC